MKKFFTLILFSWASCFAQTLSSPDTADNHLKRETLTPREILIKAFTGKFSPESCTSKTVYEYILDNEFLKGTFKGDGRLIATINIPLGSAKYFGFENGFHKIMFTTFQENVSNKSLSQAEILIETDFKIRRTISSKVNQAFAIKDGIVLSNGKKPLEMIKCESLN